MNEQRNAARGRKRIHGTNTWMRGSRPFGLIGAALMLTGICAMPFVATAAVPAAGCPDGTYQSWTESYDPPESSVAVGNLPVTYVWVDSANGRFLFGDGVPMNNTSIDVVAGIGVPATAAGFCKGTAVATTTTTSTTTTSTTTTTTVPESTTTTSTTMPETTTTTSTTVPETTTTTTSTTTPTTSTTTSTTVPETTTTSTATTTVPGSTTTTTEPPSSPPTTGTPGSSTTTTIPVFAALPPGQAAPPSPPPGTGSTGPTPLGTTLPETGQSSRTGVTLGVAVLGFGMVLVAVSRRSAS